MTARHDEKSRHGPPACFAELLLNAAFEARQLVEEAAEAEMIEILREFARQHEDFLREEERARRRGGDHLS
jgi:hypothetical protein